MANDLAAEGSHFVFLCPGNMPAAEAIARLQAIGIDIDEGWAPVVVSPQSGDFTLRGSATPAQSARAERELGITSFPDQSIGPLDP